VEKKLAFLLFVVFWLKILPQLNIKALHNLKKFGHRPVCVCASFRISTVCDF